MDGMTRSMPNGLLTVTTTLRYSFCTSTIWWGFFQTRPRFGEDGDSLVRNSSRRPMRTAVAAASLVRANGL